MKTDIYVSVDVETDGSAPGVNSMLSLGAAAFRLDSEEPISTFEVNLLPLLDAKPDPETMAWWGRQDPAVWAHVRSDRRPPRVAMVEFAAWLKTLPGTPVLVTYPEWDYAWVLYYSVRFLGDKLFFTGGIDIKSVAWALFKDRTFAEARKKDWPPQLLTDLPPHTHRAMDDAIEQGVLFVRLNALRQRMAEEA